MTLRWGIVTAGKISHDFCVALSLLEKQHQVVAVAARQLERAQQFAQQHNIPNAYGSYKQLAENPNIDVVYIGALNPQHLELSLLLLDHGKHVLCEKPLCMNYKEAEQLIKHAEAKKLFLMEGAWSRFFPAYQYLRQQIDAGALGNIQEVIVEFGFPLTDVERLQKKDLGGGVTLDLGIYTIQVSQWAFREAPSKIIAKGELNSEGVDIYVEAELHYSNNGIARMRFGAKQELNNKAIIKGDKGQITLLNFWSPTKLIDVDGSEKEWPLTKGKLPTNYINSEGFQYEAEAVRQSLAEGKLQNDTVSHVESLLFARIEDEIRKQVGVKIDEL